ncbi:hypothetical protein XHV734_3414 [Xanthomonas hortorum pv. vitians]|nr:hypothetical protein XHV734_3414 [Xanthomonas hortorum pv. vitians]
MSCVRPATTTSRRHSSRAKRRKAQAKVTVDNGGLRPAVVVCGDWQSREWVAALVLRQLPAATPS